MWFPPSFSTGKERDEETGFGYFGARYYWSEVLTGWLSVDPMADKYPGISPYAYCAWNPVKLVDPDGRDVFFTGDDDSKAEALRQIQQKSKNMFFSLDENNRLTYTGEAKTEEEKYMAKIINSKEVIIDLCIHNNKYFNGKKLETIGGFDGNALSKDGKSVYASQIINIRDSDKWDKLCKNLGNAIWHEIAEAYEGGLLSIDRQQDAEPAFAGKKDNPIYQKAHYNAGKYFPGTVNIDNVVLPQKVQDDLKKLEARWGREFDVSYIKYTYGR